MADEEATQNETPGWGNGGATAATKTAPVKKPEQPTRKPKHLPPYRVLLHNDDVNTFEHVITSILCITTLTLEDAVTRAIEAHESGLALLLVTHFELAELYREQFTSSGVTVTIEPAEE